MHILKKINDTIKAKDTLYVFPDMPKSIIKGGLQTKIKSLPDCYWAKLGMFILYLHFSGKSYKRKVCS